MEYIILVILQSMWLFLPAYIANMAPVFVKNVPFLNHRVDMGVTYDGEPLFGSHKTYRGFFFGILCAIAVVYLQTFLASQGGFFATVTLIPYDSISPVIVGFLLGGGALVGDLVESFFKRRIGVSPGKEWFPFDQIDYVVGALLFVSVIYIPTVVHIMVMLFLGLLFSLVTSYFGYYLGLKDSKI